VTWIDSEPHPWRAEVGNRDDSTKDRLVRSLAHIDSLGASGILTPWLDRMSRHRAISVCATARSLGPNPAQQRTINGGKSCQTLTEFALVEATIGPIDVDLCPRWVYGVKSPEVRDVMRDRQSWSRLPTSRQAAGACPGTPGGLAG
jgi:hypothetical protein